MTEVEETKVSTPSGDFHTQANLTQTLNAIVTEHFRVTHQNEEEQKKVLPNFMAEAIHMILSNISNVANGDPLHKAHWKNAAAYCQVVINILEKVEKEQDLMAQKALQEYEKAKVDKTNDTTPEKVQDIPIDEGT